MAASRARAEPEPEPPLRGAPQPRPAGGIPYGCFLGAVATWFGAWGMQMVLVTWLLVRNLGLSSDLLGFAQMALMAPSLLFLLIGGVAADRYERRALLMCLHGLAAAVTASLAAAVHLELLSYPLLLFYAASMGTIQAFIFPARDALLAQVAGPNMLRAVGGMTLIQFAIQGLGLYGGGALQEVGSSAAALLLQAGILLSGIVVMMGLPSSPPPQPRVPLRWGEVLEGLREVMRSPVMRPTFFLTASIGLFFMGPYFVTYPIMVRDVWQGGAKDLGLLHAMFPLAGAICTLVLICLGTIGHRGRALLISLGGGSLCLLSVSAEVSYGATLAISLIWGLCGGIFLNASRTLFQEAAPAGQRARVLSVYTMGFMGTGAVGLPLAGYLTEALGPHGVFRLSGAAMLIFLVGVVALADVGKAR